MTLSSWLFIASIILPLCLLIWLLVSKPVQFQGKAKPLPDDELREGMRAIREGRRA